MASRSARPNVDPQELAQYCTHSDRFERSLETSDQTARQEEGTQEEGIGEVAQGIDWTQLLRLVDWNECIVFHFNADANPQALDSGSESLWLMFLDRSWESSL